MGPFFCVTPTINISVYLFGEAMPKYHEIETNVSASEILGPIDEMTSLCKITSK